ncbi:MAG TPA: Rid family hydrolase [Bryobacteraceae bacterium]
MKASSGLASLGLVLALSALAQPPPQLRQPRKPKNEDREPVTQALPVLKDPPAAVAAETAKLTFHVSPLSAKGLLSPQTRDAIGALMKLNRGARIVKLRAFVAGTGDMRRVQSIVSEIFTDKKQPLPALSTIQVGALPMEGAQVVIESVSEEKKPKHPFGLVFFSGQTGDGVAAAISRLAAAATSAQVPAAGMLRVTCFLGSVEEIDAARGEAARVFPAAALDFVQAIRGESGTSAVCEGAGSKSEAGPPVALTPGAAAVSMPKLVFTGTQLAFREQDADLRLAFERLEKSLEPLGVAYKDVVFSRIYPLNRSVGERTTKMASEFLSPNVPFSPPIFFEGLPSLDSTVAVEVVAASR